MKNKRIFGLVGHPLGHSFSQRYFSAKFEREGIDARYVNYDLDDLNALKEILDGGEAPEGFNVTIPYKRAIFEYLDDVDPTARAIGAVNVVKVDAKGSLKGFNTDCAGFARALQPMLDGSERRALVLGTGGASKAVVYALEQMGMTVTKVSRNPGDGVVTYDALTPGIIGDCQVIVNATPLGMWPRVEGCPTLDYGAVDSRHKCFDLVYNPLETEFMKRCAARGAAVQNGLRMLELQALAAWDIWNKK